MALDLYSEDDPKTLERVGLSGRKTEVLAAEMKQARPNSAEPIPVGQPQAERSRFLGATVRNVNAEGNEKVLAIQASFEQEFNDAMDRVSGWYKRKATIWITFISVLVVFALNADTVRIAEDLRANPEALARLNDSVAKTVEAEAVQTPSGNTEQTETGKTAGGRGRSVAAIALGAPFWFQALGRLVPLRNTGKKPETKPDAVNDEASG